MKVLRSSGSIQSLGADIRIISIWYNIQYTVTVDEDLIRKVVVPYYNIYIFFFFEKKNLRNSA